MNVKIKKIKNWTLKTIIILIVATLCINIYVNSISEKYIFFDETKLPNVKYGLLLGTSKYFKKGEDNDFYINRISAATLLYNKGRIRKIVISGTHEETYYSEPLSIRSDLIKKGIPDSAIELDYFGDRTILSIKNFKEKHSADSVIIISQKFHNQRAVYLARRCGIEAWGYNANDVKFKSAYKVLFREYFAKTKAVFE